MSITYSECVSVVLVNSHVVLLRRILLSSVACLSVTYSSTLSQKGTVFGKCEFCFSIQILSKTFLILGKKNQRDIIINARRTSIKVPAILVRF